MAYNIPKDMTDLFPATCDLNDINENQSAYWSTYIPFPQSSSAVSSEGTSSFLPGITSLGFFMRNHVKSTVYQSQVTEIDDLKRRIMDSITTVHADMLLRTWQELEYRLDIVRATKGAHIEVS